MMEVIVLGSSGSSPAKGRQMPSVALRRNGEVFLFDCGEGTQMQMLKYGINSYRIKAIFVSHAHGDHVIGIAGLVRTLALANRKEPLSIFVPEGQEKIIRSLVVFDKALMNYEIRILGIRSGIIYRGKDFSVRAFRLNHTIQTCGYVFVEDDKRRFIKEKCEKLKIKGEMFSLLEEKKRIRIGGRVVKLNDVTKTQKGKKVVYAADTRPSISVVKAAVDADLLLHESSYTQEYIALARARKHSTAFEAATVARKAKARMLVLVHISTRFKSAEPLEKEARTVFRNTVVAKDGDRFCI